MHRAVADAIAGSEPLAASRHYIEAGDHSTAMSVLGDSVLLTMGSGQWGIASTLIDRLGGVPADAAVAALRARRLIEDGDLVGASDLLRDIDPSSAAKEARAVFRFAKLSLGWRLADRDLLIAALDEIECDPETPTVLADIAQVYRDSRSDSPTRPPYPILVRRLETMAQSQQTAGHGHYSAISLHNAAIAQHIAGDSTRAIRLAERALDAFDLLSYPASERYSTHAVLATCWADVGDRGRAEEHVELGLASGSEHADVPAAYAFLFAHIGERDRAESMLAAVEDLDRRGLSDLEFVSVAANARALLKIADDPASALDLMASVARDNSSTWGAPTTTT